MPPAQDRRPARTSRAPVALVLLLDLALVVVIARLPSRVELPAVRDELPAVGTGFAAVTPDQALFVVTAPRPANETLAVRVPLAPPGARAVVERLGTDFAVLDRVMGLDGIMPTGSRWAWNGRTLLLAAPSRRLGAHRVFVVLIGARGRVLPPREIDGTRPSAGWARDHFEVTYVAPAPPPDAGRVQWAIDVDEQGAVSHERIVEPAGVAHRPFVWPAGARTPTDGAGPYQLVLPDGRVVEIPRTADEHDRLGGAPRARPFFVLGRDGAIDVRFATADLAAGSELAGDYTGRVTIGPLTIEAHQGAHVARPRVTVARGGRRVAFEVNQEPRWRDLIAAERDGVLHLLDPRGFHARLRASDLAPLDPRASRLSHLAGMLGTSALALVILALVVAHALALVVERAARRPGRSATATFAGLLAVFLAGAAVLWVWYASSA